MLPHPGIHQGVTGTAVKTGNSTAVVKEGYIRNASDVDHCRGVAPDPEGGPVEGGGQRRTLTPSRHIPSAEVGHGEDPGQFRDSVRVTDLQGET